LVQPKLDADGTATTIEEKITAKYFIAGASARWMFFFNTQDSVMDIRFHLARAPDAGQLAKGFVGERSTDAVNHLMSQVQGENVLVSEFVARELAKTATVEFIKTATLQALKAGNPSFNGWIFQMDFLHHLQSAQRNGETLELIDTTKRKTSYEHWNASNIAEFYTETDLNTKYATGTWLLPTKINQGCYDVLQVWYQSLKIKKHTVQKIALRVVQLTVAATHKLKMRYVIPILDQLASLGINIQFLDVVIVVPSGQEDKFAIGEVSSDTDHRFKALGWSKNDYRVLGYRRVST